MYFTIIFLFGGFICNAGCLFYCKYFKYKNIYKCRDEYICTYTYHDWGN